MVKNCFAYGCRNRVNKCNENVHYHRLPANLWMRRKWLVACGRPHLDPGKHTYICSEHFEPSCYEKAPEDLGFHVKVKLRPKTYPTIFPNRPPMVDTSTGDVEFKPEMWGDGAIKAVEGQPPAKRPRGRPRKNISTNIRVDGDVVIKSEFVSCCALACTNTSESFIMNCLPRNTELRRKWIERIDRLDWMPDSNSALCEIHFEAEMWDQDVGEEKILKLDAVPSLFLHGEAIKSWVTMDKTGNVENIVVGDHIEDHNNEDTEEDHASDIEEEDPDLFVKREALEPEIDMVEGSEDVLSQDASSTEEQFETIYCDSTFNEEMEGYKIRKEESGNPLDPDLGLIEELSESNLSENPMSPIIQDEEVSCMADSFGSLQDQNQEESKVSNFLVLSKPSYLKKVIRRRNSSQLSDDFQCPICERRLSRRKNLEIHMEKLHPNGELSEHHKKKLQQPPMKEETKRKPVPFKKPPPALTPLLPKFLLAPTSPVVSSTFTHSSIGPLVPGSLTSSAILATPSTLISPSSLVAAPNCITSPTLATSTTLLATSSVVTSPMPKDPSPTGGEMKKQFLLLLPKPPNSTEHPAAASEDSHIYSVNLSSVPLDKRILLKEKLKELVDAVVTKNLNPDKIIIAYDRT